MGDEFKPTHVVKPDHCQPGQPVPHEEHEPCVGTFTMERCCCKLMTRTFVLQEGPKTEPQLLAFNQATFTAWENAGYLILSQSLVDTGAGWQLSFTVGWYI